jgi:hypothetical protein
MDANPWNVDLSWDIAFDRTPDLVWRPWVGQEFRQAKAASKVLIVGESHYARRIPGVPMEMTIAEQMNKRDYTRQVIWECPVRNLWRNPTLSRIAPILLGRGAYDRESLWADVAFFNLVQRSLRAPPKDNPPKEEVPERPTDADFELGWGVFLAIVKLVDPDICLCLGISAHRCFGRSMERNGTVYDFTRIEKVGRCWGYSGTFTSGESRVPIVFVQHPNRFFPTSSWHGFVLQECPAIATLTAHRIPFTSR